MMLSKLISILSICSFEVKTDILTLMSKGLSLSQHKAMCENVISMHKGHVDKAKAGRFKDGRQQWVGQGARWGGNGVNCP